METKGPTLTLSSKTKRTKEWQVNWHSHRHSSSYAAEIRVTLKKMSSYYTSLFFIHHKHKGMYAFVAVMLKYQPYISTATSTFHFLPQPLFLAPINPYWLVALGPHSSLSIYGYTFYSPVLSQGRHLEFSSHLTDISQWTLDSNGDFSLNIPVACCQANGAFSWDCAHYVSEKISKSVFVVLKIYWQLCIQKAYSWAPHVQSAWSGASYSKEYGNAFTWFLMAFDRTMSICMYDEYVPPQGIWP